MALPPVFTLPFAGLALAQFALGWMLTQHGVAGAAVKSPSPEVSQDADGAQRQEPPPAVSVIIPCRDARYLFETLDSLAEQQDAPSFEVVVVDDTDHDLSVVLNSWHDRLQLRVMKTPARAWAGANRNFGAGDVRAPLLLFVDADDTVGPKYIRAMTDALESHQFVCSRIEISFLNPPESHSKHPQWNGLIAAELNFLPFAGSGTLGIRRSLFAEMGGFDSSLPCYEEVDLCWRIQLAGHDPPYWVSEAVLHYRQHLEQRARLRRAVAFGRVQPLLYRRFHGEGMPRATIGRASVELAQLSWRLLRDTIGSRPPSGTRQLAAIRLGRILGSLKYRVLYL